MTRAVDLRSDYARLGNLLDLEEDGAKAAALARERRMLGELIEALEAPEGANLVDELAERRGPTAEDVGPATGRRRSRGG